MLLLERDFQIPDAAARKAYLLEKKLPDEKIRQVIDQAMEERGRGMIVNLLVMKKNRKFQKEQLEAEGYTEIVDVFAR